MRFNSSEKGQALIVITLAAVVLFGFAGLAIDSSRAFEDKRHAQNAADTAALAGALAYSRGQDINTAAQNRATTNQYDNNGTTNTVTVSVATVASGGCPGNAAGKEITVTIVSTIDTTIMKVFGQNTVTNAVTATARGCGYITAPLFNGDAIVSLSPANNPCAYDSGNSNAAHWTIEGGGIFSNGCAFSKNGDSVTLDPDKCVTTVGTAQNFTCMQQNQTSKAISYPAGALAIMPPNPCDGTPGDVGLPQGSGSTFSNGVYCISDLDALDKEDIILDNATLYVTDTQFDLKFAGGGGFSGTASQRGDFAGYYMVVAYNGDPCQDFTDHTSQVIEWRGNGSGTFYGTILAPSACIDLRGNGESSGMHTQVIAYNVSSNGNAEVYVNYEKDENHQIPYTPSITLLR
jgi:Flp pilus assembly protein TadG